MLGRIFSCFVAASVAATVGTGAFSPGSAQDEALGDRRDCDSAHVPAG